MKPRKAIDDWIRDSSREYHVMSKPTNQNKNMSNSMKTRRNSRSRDYNEIRGCEDNMQGFQQATDGKRSGKKYVEKLIHKISKLNNASNADTSYVLQSDASTDASYNTSSDWSQCAMGESSLYDTQQGSPITISSGYGSDFLPTCEEEIDGLLYSERQIDVHFQKSKETSRNSTSKRDQTQANYRAWPGRHDLFDHERIERHNHKLTKVKKSMRGIIKDLKDIETDEQNKTRRSRSFDNSAGKSQKDERDSKGRRRGKSFSENRRERTNSYTVMNCYHGEHWVDCQSRGTTCVDLGSSCCNSKPKTNDRKKHRGKRQRRRNETVEETPSGFEQEQLWRHLADNFVTPHRGSPETVRVGDRASPLGPPLMSSSPKCAPDLDDRLHDNVEEHIYETIPGDDYSVEIIRKEIPPELPERNYKKRDSAKSDDREYWPDRPLNKSCDINNNVVPKFWDRLDGVSRETRDKATKCPPGTMTLGRPRRSPLSSRRSREERKSDAKNNSTITCAKTNKNRDQLDVSTLKTKTHSHHEYTVADVLDSIGRFERDDPDLIQSIPWGEVSRGRDSCEGYWQDDFVHCSNKRSPRCGHPVVRHPHWSSHLLAADEIII